MYFTSQACGYVPGVPELSPDPRIPSPAVVFFTLDTIFRLTTCIKDLKRPIEVAVGVTVESIGTVAAGLFGEQVLRQVPRFSDTSQNSSAPFVSAGVTTTTVSSETRPTERERQREGERERRTEGSPPRPASCTPSRLTLTILVPREVRDKSEEPPEFGPRFPSPLFWQLFHADQIEGQDEQHPQKLWRRDERAIGQRNSVCRAPVHPVSLASPRLSPNSRQKGAPRIKARLASEDEVFLTRTHGALSLHVVQSLASCRTRCSSQHRWVVRG